MKKAISWKCICCNQGIRGTKSVLILFLFITMMFPKSLMADPIFTSTFGTPGNGDGQFNSPREGIATSSTGDLYVADTSNNRVQIFNPDDTYKSKFGTFGIGDGQFRTPRGIAFSAGGDIYVADGNNNRIQIFNPNNTYKSQFGTPGVGDGQFHTPIDVIIPSTGDVYVTDSNNSRVQIFNPNNTYKSQFGVAGTENGQFQAPIGIIVSPGGVAYVTDSNNNRVQIFNPNNTYKSQFGVAGTENGQFNDPRGIAMSSTGNVYVTDTGNNRVQVFDSTGTYKSQFGSAGAGPGQFNGVYGITVQASTGKIYAVDQTNNYVSVWFDPKEWTQAGTSRLAQLPLNQPLTLNAGFNLQVTNGLALNAGANLILSGGTFTQGTLTANGGAITDTATSTVAFPLALGAGGGTLSSASGNTFTYSGDITGGNSLNIKGLGKVNLTGNNNVGNIIIDPNATLQGNAASLITDIVDNGHLVFLQQVDASHFHTISGPGDFKKLGTGKLTFEGAQTYTGITRVETGTLAIKGALGGGIAVNNGATFNVEGAVLTAANPITNNGIVNFNAISSPGDSTITNNTSTLDKRE